MAIRRDGEGFTVRIARIDNGSDVDAISQEVLTALGQEMQPYDGLLLSLVNGDNLFPLGEIELEWHMLKTEGFRTTRFVVLKAGDSRDSDVVLGRETLRRLEVMSSNPPY